MSGVSTLDFVRLIGTALLGLQGVWMVLDPERFRRQGVLDNERKLTERLASGKDRYFEELRSLKAYSQPSPRRTVRLFGILFALLGIASFGASLTPFLTRS